MDSLITALRQYTTVSADLENRITQVFTEKKVDKQAELLKEAGYCNHFYFIESGLLRSYFLQDGKERTYWFYAEDQFCTAWYSFYTGEPSFETLEAIEPSTLWAISKTDFEALADTHREFERFARKFIEIQYAVMDNITKNFQDLTATEKYESLTASMPNLDQRAKLGQIASFLGMSQETLSRLRGKK